MLADATGDLQVILLASGSEVQIAVAAREALQAEGIGTRVVSVPCLDWFQAQDSAYIESVLPSAVTARVSIEAGIAQPWWRWLGSHGRPVSLEHYGASADFKVLYKEFGITAEAAVAAAHESLTAAGAGPARAPSRARTSCRMSAPTSPSLNPTPSTSVPVRKLIIMSTPTSTDPLADLATAGVRCGWMICPGNACSRATWPN